MGRHLHLPMRDLAAALPFYETILGFMHLSHTDVPCCLVRLDRETVQIGL